MSDQQIAHVTYRLQLSFHSFLNFVPKAIVENRNRKVGQVIRLQVFVVIFNKLFYKCRCFEIIKCYRYH